MKIGISGINGRVGKIIYDELKNDEFLTPSIGLSRFVSDDSSEIKTTNNICHFLECCDCVIDFSSPELLEKICEENIKYKKIIISGTSGLSENQIEKLKQNGKFAKVFWSMNTSFGLNFVAKIVENIAKSIKEAEIEIHEEHHNQKKDAPSGTAIMLGNKILKAREQTKKSFSIDRNHKRENGEIGFSSIRAGNIIGKHDVSFYFGNELIKISHEAFERKVFATGAIKIAKIIIEKKEEIGFFESSDIF